MLGVFLLAWLLLIGIVFWNAAPRSKTSTTTA